MKAAPISSSVTNTVKDSDSNVVTIDLPQEMIDDLINLLDDIEELPDVLAVLINTGRPVADLRRMVHEHHKWAGDITVATADHYRPLGANAKIDWTRVYGVIVTQRHQYDISGWMPYRGNGDHQDTWYVTDYNFEDDGYIQQVGFYHYKTDFFTQSNDEMIEHVARYMRTHGVDPMSFEPRPKEKV